VKVKDAMHKGVDWVSPDTPVTELAKLMCEHDIGAIPIGENDRLIGMVTDRDIVCKGLAQDSFDVRRATARDVMTPGIHCCRDDDDLAKAVRHMEKLQVRRLPVINKSRRMVGILSLGDVSNSAPGFPTCAGARSGGDTAPTVGATRRGRAAACPLPHTPRKHLRPRRVDRAEPFGCCVLYVGGFPRARPRRGKRYFRSPVGYLRFDRAK
jgi:CBS domain-containing protein